MKLFLPIIAILVFCGTSYGQGKGRTAFGLHQQFVQNRAIKGYKAPPAFQWKAQAHPGLVGVNRNSGFWQNGRYQFYRQPQQLRYQPQQRFYYQSQPTYYQQPVQTFYQQPAQTYYYLPQ